MNIKKYIYLIVSIGICLTSCKNTPSEGKQYISIPQLNHEFEYLVRPSTTAEEQTMLILLHGWGSNKEDLFALSEHIDPRYFVISAQGPIDRGDDRYGWYQLDSTADGYVHNPTEVLESSKSIIRFVKQMKVAYKMQGAKVYLGGFSQGAIMSLGTALTFPTEINGAICLSGELYPEFMKSINKETVKGLNIFISHGTNDSVLPFQNIESTVKTLQTFDVNLEFKSYDSGHTISSDNFRDLLIWLNKQLLN